MKINPRVNPNIFRAYDIRGIYPEEINEEAAYLIGRAFVKFLNKPKANIVVGRDNRLSSPALFKNLVKGITDQGANVIDIGLSTTPMFYFATAYYGFDGGVEISASHNPPQYNGFKLVREGAISVSGESGIKEIQKMVQKGKSASWRKRKKEGKVFKKKVISEYVKFNLKNFDLSQMRNLKIVIDVANAVPGIAASEFFQKIDCRTYYLYPELDGSFPNHPPCPHEEKNLKELKKEVLSKNADLGIAFDGDGDRVIFVNEQGKMISGDLITALLVSLILREAPGEKVLCDIRSSNLIRDTVKEMGGIPVIGRVGHSFIKEKMRKENIIFQGELNGHYYLREHYFSEAPFFVIFKILGEMSKTKKTISELVKPYEKYYHSGEINFKVKDKKKILKILEDKFGKGGQISKIDGLRIDFLNWWFNIRPSHTEPVLRLVVEAKTKKLMEKKKKEIISLINPES